MVKVKKWLISAGLILLFALCAGCSKNTPLKTDGLKQGNNETENQSNEKAGMTEQQEEVFRSYGLSDERIDKMKKEGLSYKEESFVDNAIKMLDYLEEKYNEKFKVVGGDIPGILSDEYWITAEACEGKHAGEKFKVDYLKKDSYRDGYIALLKQDEACGALKNLISGEFSDVLIFPSVTGEYGEELAIDNTGEEMLKIVSYYCDFVITKPGISEEDFMKLSKGIEDFLNENNIFSSGCALYLNKTINLDMTGDALNELLKDDSILRWSYYISSR